MQVRSFHRIEVEVEFPTDQPLFIDGNAFSDNVFAYRVTMLWNGSFWSGEALGFNQKKDGSMGKADRRMHAVRISDLRADVASAVLAERDRQVDEAKREAAEDQA